MMKLRDRENKRLRAAIEQAYGILWRDTPGSHHSHDARKILLQNIDREGQARGIAYAINRYGEVTEEEATGADK